MLKEKKEKLIIIDGHALIYRAWFALPPLTIKSGEVVNAIYGFTSTLFKVIKDMKPDYLAVVLDEKGPTFRHLAYTAYKATRVIQPDDFYNQIPHIRSILDSLKIQTLSKKGYEADDIIGSLVETFKSDDLKINIITKDFDIFQLIQKGVSVISLEKGLSEFKEFDVDEVKKKYDLSPHEIIDYKALRGDSSDNIKGVPGIGDKTAKDIVKKFGTIENLYKELPHIKNTNLLSLRTIELLGDNKNAAVQSKKLVTLKTDMPIKQKLSEFKIVPIDTSEAYTLFHKFEFRTLIPKLSLLAKNEPKKDSVSSGIYKNVTTKKDLEALIKLIEKKGEFAFDTETTGTNSLLDLLVGISFSIQAEEAYWISKKIVMDNVKIIKSLFASKTIKKIAHNMKFDVSVLRTAGFEVNGLFFDTMIAANLLSTGGREQSLKALAFIEFGHQMTTIEELIGMGKKQITMDQVSDEKLIPYASADADFTWRLYKIFIQRLIEKKLDDIFYDIEMPLINILETMERTGITLDIKELSILTEKVTKKLKTITASIYVIAGKEFNISSPKQLKEILFEKLEISTDFIKSTKTGISTAASELAKLKGQHPIIDLIIDYRELSKLNNTYLEPLPKLINPKTGRIHTTYNQTGAATGRFSSTNPNLQNIPIRTDLGNEIRKSFTAGKGTMLLAADYSQIELRIAAHLANDTNMINAFKNNEDIHISTAAVINDVEEKDVTPKMRSNAKEINFGVLFGMNAFGLSMRTDISPHEAQEFLSKYFEHYSDLKEYLKEVIEEAREKGYVESMLGRRRYLPDIHAKNPQIRLATERMAVNMPIQGTEADIIKLAMIALNKKIVSKDKDVNFVLQVHDELVLEIPITKIKKLAPQIGKIMSSVVKLKVPITTKLSIGSNWHDLKVFH